jgi:hypothetical protein
MTTSITSPNVPASAKEQAHALYLEMESCFEANLAGGTNPHALNQLQTLALHLKWTSSLFSEKAASFAHWAEVLYSPRKHSRWNTACESGQERVAHFMRCDLASISIILCRME